jgi:hypothetical protein
VRWALAAVGLVALALSLGACCDEHPRDLYPQPPETVCQTGVEVGMDIAAWDCIHGERVVAWRTSSALLGRSDVKVERAPCGTPTAFERGLHEQDLTRCPLLKPK